MQVSAIVILSLGIWVTATTPALADNFDWDATSKRINSNWDKIKTPGKIQQPGPIQKAGTIQKVSGEWKVPGAIQAPGGVNIKQDNCNKRLMVSGDTLFEFNKYTLSKQAEKTLTQIGTIIKGSGEHPVMVEGHTDAIGNEAYNQKLSEDRAATVKKWLVGHGFMNENGKVTGYGKTRPVARNTTPDGKDYPEGRRLNRRVEVVIDTCTTLSGSDKQ